MHKICGGKFSYKTTLNIGVEVVNYFDVALMICSWKGFRNFMLLGIQVEI
jgi:hypothetical protein